MKTTKRFCLKLAAAFFAMPMMMHAQTSIDSAAPVIGKVQDALNRPLFGAKVWALAADGKSKAESATDSGGHFELPGLKDGIYAITASAKDFDTGSAVVTVRAGRSVPVSITLTARQVLKMAAIAARKLDEARTGLSPTTGTSLYHIDATAVKTQAQGEATPINHVLLTAPGVAQDSYGQIHVRGEHADVQYRINGLLLPEGISGGFAQDVDTRFADKIDFLTGALPAQYGDRTAGVVDITTKSGAFENGGRVGIYGGQNNWLEPSLELQGHSGDFNYYLSGSYLQNDLGIEAPTNSDSPLHDHTQQEKGFSYLSYLINPTLRASALFGTSVGSFQIPDNPGQDSAFSVNGVDASSHPSSGLDETQDELNHYGMLALQGGSGGFNYQAGAFLRYSSTHFHPDSLGDLIYNGVASDVYRSDVASGFQADLSWKLGAANTLRAGATLSVDQVTSDNTAAVFPVDSAGNPSSTLPLSIVDDNHKIGSLYSLYLQDEWKVADSLTVNYGARFDAVDAYVQEWQVSPRVNLSYRLAEGTQFHAGYSRYFSPPPLELVAPKDLSLFQGTTNASEVNVASNVRSERDNYYDVGVIQRLFENFQLGLDGYYKDAAHLLDEGQFGAALVFTPFNYVQGKVYGLEASTSYHDRHVNAYVNAAYSVAQGIQIESSEFSFGQDELDSIANRYIYLDHDQRITISYGLAYTWLQTTLGLDGIFGSGLRRGFINGGKMPVYYQVNLSVSQQFSVPSLGAFDARVSALNFFDIPYQLRDGSGVGVGAPQWGPRRAFYAGLSKPFSF